MQIFLNFSGFLNSISIIKHFGFRWTTNPSLNTYMRSSSKNLRSLTTKEGSNLSGTRKERDLSGRY